LLGTLDLVLTDYESAEHIFGKIAATLTERGDRFKPYLWIASFGQGLAQGIRQRKTTIEPKPTSEVAIAAKNLYDVFLSFGKMPSSSAKYRSLGESYAELGLENEGQKVLDIRRSFDILSFYKLYPEAKKLLRK